MIVDDLTRAARYGALGKNLAIAIAYLQQTDFTRIALGRQEVDGDRVFALVQTYRPKPLAEAKWETHRRYIDVQYIVRGSERMGFTLWQPTLEIIEPYDPARDAQFYRADGSLIAVHAGQIAVFMPEDVHAPGLVLEDSGPPAEVFKVVMKCAV